METTSPRRCAVCGAECLPAQGFLHTDVTPSARTCDRYCETAYNTGFVRNRLAGGKRAR